MSKGEIKMEENHDKGSNMMTRGARESSMMAGEVRERV